MLNYTRTINNNLQVASSNQKRGNTELKFNLGILHKYCTLSIEEIWRINGAEIRNGNSGRHGFIDNGGDVLAVAHLDIAGGVKHLQNLFKVTAGNVVHSVALDDRLGAYLICDFLPSLGLKYDILLTENEEIGASTAADFKANGKNYNWIFQFDRRGNDVVLYEYDCKPLENSLIDHGFRVGTGSFSDICYLEDLEVKGMNFGTGYFSEHTRICHANLKITAQQIDRFLSFYGEYQDKKMYHEPLAYTYSAYLPVTKKYGKWNNYSYGTHYSNKRDKRDNYGEPLTYNYGGQWDHNAWDDEHWNDPYHNGWKSAKYNEKRKRYERQTKRFDNLYGHSVEYTEFWDRDEQQWIEDATTNPDMAILYPKYHDYRQKFLRDYSIDLADLTWEDYCGIVGVDANNINTWSEEDWIIANVLDEIN